MLAYQYCPVHNCRHMPISFVDNTNIILSLTNAFLLKNAFQFSFDICTCIYEYYCIGCFVIFNYIIYKLNGITIKNEPEKHTRTRASTHSTIVCLEIPLATRQNLRHCRNLILLAITNFIFVECFYL